MKRRIFSAEDSNSTFDDAISSFKDDFNYIISRLEKLDRSNANASQDALAIIKHIRYDLAKSVSDNLVKFEMDEDDSRILAHDEKPFDDKAFDALVDKRIAEEFSSNDDEDEEEMTFDDWYDTNKALEDGVKFITNLENLVRSKYDVEEFFEEPSVQGRRGMDYIDITLSGGRSYGFEFDWFDEQYDIYTYGPKQAAKIYFQDIIKKLGKNNKK